MAHRQYLAHQTLSGCLYLPFSIQSLRPTGKAKCDAAHSILLAWKRRRSLLGESGFIQVTEAAKR